MARVRMIKLLAGPDGAMHPGKSYDVSDDLALALLEANAATLLDGDIVVRTVEHQANTPPENATATRQRKPRGQ